MHTTAEDRGRLFRVDSAEERKEWIDSIKKLSAAAKKEEELLVWRSMSSYQKAYSVVAKVQRHPTTSGIMCCFVFIDSILTCVDKQLTEEEMGPRVLEVLLFSCHHQWSAISLLTAGCPVARGHGLHLPDRLHGGSRPQHVDRMVLVRPYSHVLNPLTSS